MIRSGYSRGAAELAEKKTVREHIEWLVLILFECVTPLRELF